jgi:sulfonate transport system ATP-binding protein
MKTDKTEHAYVEAADPGAKRGIRVAVQGVSKSYSGREVLKSVDLAIEAGEFVAVIGRSGCGKSTLLRLIAELEPATRGAISFGENAHQPATRIMFQDSRLLPWKRVVDNIALGLSKATEKAAQALENVGLKERAREWPAVLSGGQRQRVALARALVHDPLGALDALTRIEMQQLIETLWRQRGFTALLVTHDVQEAIALADRVVLIEDGRITLDERVALPRPRARGDLAFAQLEERLLQRLLQRLLRHPASLPDNPLGDVSLLKTVSQVAWTI